MTDYELQQGFGTKPPNWKDILWFIITIIVLIIIIVYQLYILL